jgi:hypothetical protein
VIAYLSGRWQMIIFQTDEIIPWYWRCCDIRLHSIFCPWPLTDRFCVALQQVRKKILKNMLNFTPMQCDTTPLASCLLSSYRQ